MRNSQPLKQTLCLNYCVYFKPGKDEGLACRGYVVVEKLMRSGKVIAFERSGKKPDVATNESLVQKMCMICDFHEHDCDFMQDRRSPPCGGFVLLLKLLSSETITLEDIG